MSFLRPLCKIGVKNDQGGGPEGGLQIVVKHACLLNRYYRVKGDTLCIRKKYFNTLEFLCIMNLKNQNATS